jgi:hypothetical protein
MDNSGCCRCKFRLFRIAQIETKIGIIRSGHGDKMAADAIAFHFVDNSVLPDQTAASLIEGKSNPDAIIRPEIE